MKIGVQPVLLQQQTPAIYGLNSKRTLALCKWWSWPWYSNRFRQQGNGVLLQWLCNNRRWLKLLLWLIPLLRFFHVDYVDSTWMMDQQQTVAAAAVIVVSISLELSKLIMTVKASTKWLNGKPVNGQLPMYKLNKLIDLLHAESTLIVVTKLMSDQSDHRRHSTRWRCLEDPAASPVCAVGRIRRWQPFLHICTESLCWHVRQDSQQCCTSLSWIRIM